MAKRKGKAAAEAANPAAASQEAVAPAAAADATAETEAAAENTAAESAPASEEQPAVGDVGDAVVAEDQATEDAFPARFEVANNLPSKITIPVVNKIIPPRSKAVVTFDSEDKYRRYKTDAETICKLMGRPGGIVLTRIIM